MKLPPKPKRGTKSDNGFGVIYARYSSQKQNDESIEQQVAQCQQLAADCGIHVLDIYPDRAVSGKTDKRPFFQKMMQDASRGRFQYVLSWKSNRIGRNMVEALSNEVRLNELGIRILYVEEDFDDTAAGRFAARSMMNVNQFYNENLAEDVQRSMIANAMECKANGRVPLGYATDKNKKYIIDEPNAEVVREIFDRVTALESFTDICNDLNARGIRTAIGHPFTVGSFGKLLQNERYIGYYIYGTVRIKDGVPRIISDETFYKVQEILKMKKNPRGRHRVGGDYALTGKLFCGSCGSHMIGMSGTGQSGEMHYYYACSGKRTKSGCPKKSIPREYCEIQIARGIQNYIIRDDVCDWIADSVIAYQKQNAENPELVSLQDRLKTVRLSLANMVKAIEQGIITETTKTRLQELEAEQTDITREISRIKSSFFDVSREDVLSWLHSFREGSVESPEYRENLFNSFLSRAYIYDDGHAKIIFGFGQNIENSIDLDFFVEKSDNPDGVSYSSESSRKLDFGSPFSSQANHDENIVMVRSVFVLTINI